MRDLAVFIIVFSLLPLAFMRTSVGVLLWNWIGFMNPHRLGWGMAAHFKFAYFIGAVTLAGFLFSKERQPIPKIGLIIVLILFVLWMNLTTLFALVPEDATHQWSKVMKIQLFIFVALSVMQSKEKLNRLIWVITLSIGFFGIKGGFFTLIHGGHFLVLGPRSSQIQDNNTLALALIMVLPLFWYLSHQLTKRWAKIAMFVSMALIIVSIFGSHSRGALLAFCAMAAFLVWKSQHRLMLIVLLAVMIPITMHTLPEEWFSRMNTIKTYEEDASAMGRINAWHFAYNLALDRPFMGGGFETFRPGLFEKYAPNPKDYHDSHSIYFEILGEQGFVGLGLFLTILFLSWRTASAIQHHARGDPNKKWAYDLSSMTQVSLLGYMTGGAFLGVAYFDLFYSLVAFIALTHQICAVQEREQAVLKPSRIAYGPA